MPRRPTAYARNGDLHVAYQVVGGGAVDLVVVPGRASNLEAAWELPAFADYRCGLAALARLVLFDTRGTGLSDRMAGDRVPTLEERTDDVLLVMDAVGSGRAVLLAEGEGGPAAALFAATHPGRTAGLVLYGTHARGARAKGYPFGPSAAEAAEAARRIEGDAGDDGLLRTLAPGAADDPSFRDWWRTFVRRSAEPRTAAALARMGAGVDVRPVLETVTTPTLVLHRAGDAAADPRGGRWMARRIPGARFVRLPGRDHLPFVGEVEPLLGAVRDFVAGLPAAGMPNGRLAVVLATEVASSATQAVAMGDRRWMDAVEAHGAVVRWHLARYGGREPAAVRATLGRRRPIVATFDGPVRAIRCALAIRAAVRARGMEARVGIHAGQIEDRDGAVGGPGVDVALGAMAGAGAGEIVASEVLPGLVSGSGLRFEERGTALPAAGGGTALALLRVPSEPGPGASAAER